MVTAKVKKIGNLSINVISDGSALLENKFINEDDAEMDYRATEAVHSALDKARICKKPVAKYDAETKRAYVEYANGERKYVN